jgi:hypothetical protein
MKIQRLMSGMVDAGMCEMMNLIQLRQRREVSRPLVLAEYLERCEGLSRHQYYEAHPAQDVTENGGFLRWRSPVEGPFAENNRAGANLFVGPGGPSAPTVLILHALMSASDVGYRRMASWFNKRGWNAAFPHLPYHYSRVPKGTLNGELAISSHLIRNVESLRQGVIELRQLMELLRQRGSRDFGILGTSYGGWTGALLSFVETDFRFVGLVQPIVDTYAAIWKNPSARTLRHQLIRSGVGSEVSDKHSHLSSPLHGVPLCGSDKVVIAAGLYDSVSPPDRLIELNEIWTGSRLLLVNQGHFGYRAHAEMLRELDEHNFLSRA